MDQDYIQRCPYSCKEAPDTDYYSFVTTHFKKNEKKVALVDNATGESYTFGQLEQAVETVAYNLQQLGMRKNQRLALYSCNSIEYAIVLLASWRIGVITCGINHALPTSTVAYLLELTKPNMLFTDKGLLSGLTKPNLPDSTEVILRENDCEDLCYRNLLKPRPTDCEIDDVAIDTHEDVAFFCLTSGTTGQPKAVQLTHRNSVTTLLGSLAPEIQTMGKTSSLYQPLSHMMGMWVFALGLYSGSKGILMSKFDFNTFLEVLSTYKKEKSTDWPTVGTLLAMDPSVANYDLSNLQLIFNSAAPLSPKIEDAIRKRIGSPLQIAQGYGLTEGGAAALTPLKSFMDSAPSGTIGLPSPGHEIKIVDTKTGKALPANQKGELFLRSACIMKGYLDDPKATAEVIDEDKWYHTGDFGYYDDKGFLFLVDRVKELINYNAHQIAPSDIETILLSHSDVAEAAVIAVPDKVSGYVPLAFIVTEPGVTVTEDDVTSYVADRVPDHMRLRGGVKFVSSIPKSPAGKIYKRLLREHLLQ